MVAELGDVLEKVLIDFDKLFQRIGAVRLYERLDILREEVVYKRSSAMIERTIGASRFNIDMFSEVLVLRGIEKVIQDEMSEIVS